MKIPLILVGFLTAASLMFQSSKPESLAAPEVGKPAPTFRLNDHTGQLVTVGGEQERWTVVAFYPKALTPG